MLSISGLRYAVVFVRCDTWYKIPTEVFRLILLSMLYLFGTEVVTSEGLKLITDLLLLLLLKTGYGKSSIKEGEWTKIKVQ